MLPETSLFDEGPPPPCPEPFNMAAYVLAAARATPEKPALVVAGADGTARETWSHAALDRAVRATAAGLIEAGLRPGDRVALRVGHSPDFPILFFATVAAGGIAVPTSSQLTAREFAAIAADMAPRLVAVGEGLALDPPPGARVLGPDDWRPMRDRVPAEPVATGRDDPAFLVYTSGTSGRPKGVLHAHRAAWARRMMWKGWYGLGPQDRVLHAGAFNWTYTLGAGLTDPWAAGATAIICAEAQGAATWPRLARAQEATIFAAVPGVYRQILRLDDDLGHALAGLRHGLTAGERMPDSLAEAWVARTGRPVYEALGMSEVSTYLSSSPQVPRKPGFSGRPQSGRRVAVIDGDGAPVPVGEPGDLAVSVRDPGLMLGYWRDAEGTAAAFRGEWFVTGDRARMEADGYVAHLGRSDEVMTALGFRISPVEVEEALAGCPGVAEIAVAELPVREDLSLVAGFVVPRGDWPGEDALEAWAAERLAPYKRPRIWIAVDALPRTANGKLIRRALVEAHRRDR